MGCALVAAEPHHMKGWVKRFDPRLWTVDFARPMMASVVATASDSLRVEAAFHNRQVLAALIWEAEDGWDHPLLAYEPGRDFRQTQVRFRSEDGSVGKRGG